MVPYPPPASTELETEVPWETCPSSQGADEGPQAPPPAVLYPPPRKLPG